MSTLQSLKLVAAKRTAVSPIAVKRNKLANKLQDSLTGRNDFFADAVTRDAGNAI